jgi:hyaluronoglucosaminidase
MRSIVLNNLGQEGRLAEDFAINESPAIAIRGSIEAASGLPWSHRDRLDFIRFLGRVKMNRFYLAAPGEPLLSDKWREPFSENDLDRFKELLLAGTENFVSVVCGLRLASSFDFAKDVDYQALTVKLNGLRSAGVRHFLLDFNQSSSAQSIPSPERLRSLASAESGLANRVLEHLKKSGETVELSIIPNLISESGARASYLKELDGDLSSDISVIL